MGQDVVDLGSEREELLISGAAVFCTLVDKGDVVKTIFNHLLVGETVFGTLMVDKGDIVKTIYNYL